MLDGRPRQGRVKKEDRASTDILRSTVYRRTDGSAGRMQDELQAGLLDQAFDIGHLLADGGGGGADLCVSRGGVIRALNTKYR